MIDPSQVAVVLVTRGDVPLDEIVESLGGFGFQTGYAWNNGGGDENLSVYGRYAAIEKTSAPVVYVQDDDCVLPQESILALLDAYEPGVLVANLPAKFRERYTDSCLVGFGAIFDRDLPQRAFDQFDAHWGDDDSVVTDIGLFERTCDVVFSTLMPRKVLDLPYHDLPWASDESRMYRQPGHFDERLEILNLARAVRDAAVSA